MKIVIVTGMSGAGKSTVLSVFEDLDYFCIDNMPPELLSSFARLMEGSSQNVEKLCFVADVRSGEFFARFKESVEGLRTLGADVTIVYVDCDDSVIMNRYKETRRRHPLEDEASGNIMRAIEMERRGTADAREMADVYLDSTADNGTAFKKRVRAMFQVGGEGMIIDVVSFGYMYGIPRDADLVFDIRCLKNPYYVPELRQKTGLYDEVYEYVFSSSRSAELYKKIYDLVEFLIPMYEKEGKTRLVIAFGCTGGKHRSVSFARRMADDLKAAGFDSRVEHRSVDGRAEK